MRSPSLVLSHIPPSGSGTAVSGVDQVPDVPSKVSLGRHLVTDPRTAAGKNQSATGGALSGDIRAVRRAPGEGGEEGGGGTRV